MYKKILAIFILFFLICTSTIYLKAKNINEDQIMILADNNIVDFTKKLDFVSGMGGYGINEEIVVSFDETNISSYSINSSGVDIISNDNLQIKFKAQSDKPFGLIEVISNYANGDVGKGTIYTYSDGVNVTVDDKSSDTAWYNFYYEEYENGLITDDEFEEEYFNYTQQLADTNFEIVENDANLYNITNSNSNIVNVMCILEWKTKDGNKLPLINSWVELCDKEIFGNEVISSGYTDSEGIISFQFDRSNYENVENQDNLNLHIRYYPVGKTFEVAPDLLFKYNYLSSEIYTDISPHTELIIEETVEFDEHNFKNQSFYLQQGMVVGERFANALGFSTNNKINVVFPSGYLYPNDEAFCYGNDYKEYISIIGSSLFNNFDVLIHEYGHFVEQSSNLYGASLFEIFKNNPSHQMSDDHFFDKEDKEYAMELTWSESWANIFSQLAQECYSSEYPGVTNFADNIHNGYNYETGYGQYDTPSNGCEAQEFAVSKVLWHLFEPVITEVEEELDDINEGFKIWWRLTTKPGTYTLEDFVNSLNTESYEIRSKVNSLLETHQISPKLKTVTVPTLTNPPTITWIPNGSTNNPNNVFDFVFYDENGNEVYSILGYELSSPVYNTEYSYTLSDSEWTNVKNKCCTKLKLDVVVRGYRKGAKNASFDAESEFSGPYSSSYETISIDLYSLILRLNLPDGNQEFGFELPTFSWTATGGIDEYHNNYFKLILLDINKNIWFQSMFIQEQSYTMPEDIWNNILMLGLPEIYWYVEWIQTTEYFESTISNETGYVPFSTIDIINVNTTEPYTYNLQSGECQWYKFVAPYTGTFNFYTTGDTDTYGGLFDSIICNHSYDNAIIHGDDCENDCYYKCGQSDNFCIMVDLEKDQEVYLRINGYNWTSTGEYNLYVYSEHECSFIYTNAGFNTHYCDCECGNRIIEKHVIKIGTRRCLKCRAIVTNPDLELMINNVLYVTENGSYILSNGIIVLVEEDIENYFNGTIYFYRKDEEKY